MASSIHLSSQMVDITHPEAEVEILYNADNPSGGVLWVNVDGICRLRICQIDPSLLVVSIPPKVHGGAS